MNHKLWGAVAGAGLFLISAAGISVAAPAGKSTLPARKTVYLRVEGNQEKETWRLLDRAELPFTTYYPTDMIAETGSYAGGKSLKIFANFGGFRNPEARVQFFLFPRGTTEGSARATVEGIVAKLGIAKLEKNEPPHEPWALVDYSLFRDKFSGFIILGRHNDQFFHMIVDYPHDYGDGLPPRSEQIVKELRWRDTGKGF